MTPLFIELKEIKCKKCGGPLGEAYKAFLTKGELIICPFCHTTYQPTQTVTISPWIIFEKEDSKTFDFMLSESVIVGREPEHNYIVIELSRGRTENTFIRNPYVSRKHVEIKVMDEYLLEKIADKEDRVCAAKKCLLRDLGSSFGTSINNSIIQPNDERILRHSDIITLSPKSPMPVTIIFKEKA